MMNEESKNQFREWMKSSVLDDIFKRNISVIMPANDRCLICEWVMNRDIANKIKLNPSLTLSQYFRGLSVFDIAILNKAFIELDKPERERELPEHIIVTYLINILGMEKYHPLTHTDNTLMMVKEVIGFTGAFKKLLMSTIIERKDRKIDNRFSYSMFDID